MGCTYNSLNLDKNITSEPGNKESRDVKFQKKVAQSVYPARDQAVVKVENAQKLGLDAADEKLNLNVRSEEEFHNKVEEQHEAVAERPP